MDAGTIRYNSYETALKQTLLFSDTKYTIHSADITAQSFCTYWVAEFLSRGKESLIANSLHTLFHAVGIIPANIWISQTSRVSSVALLTKPDKWFMFE